MEPRPGDLGAYDPAFVARHVPWLRALLHTWFRAQVEGLEGLPAGPFVAAGTHNGSVMMPDTLVWLAAYHSAGRATPLLALAHDAIFDLYPAPLARSLAKLGGLRASFDLASEALRQGFAVQVYPGGDYDACKPFWRRHRVEFAGRQGYARLAAQAQVPIVPVVSVGAHEGLIIFSDGRRLASALGLRERLHLAVCPLSLSAPWGLWLGPPPGYLPLPTQITLQALAPISTAGCDPDDAAAVARLDSEVRGRLQAALDRLSVGRVPVLGRWR